MKRPPPAVAVTALVLSSALFAVSPVRDAVSLHEMPDVHLVRPLAYVVLAPLSDTLDTLTLLSIHQDIALVAGILLLWVIARAVHQLGRRPSWRGTLSSFVVLIAMIATAYAAAILMPRPMARLASRDPDEVRVDFHSHTSHSHDARRGFTVEANRRWHRDAGYDVAYVTDHGTFLGADRGMAEDPRDGATGVVLLSGIEVDWRGEHVGVLGRPRACRAVLSTSQHEVDTRELETVGHLGHGEPLLVWNHPRDPRLADMAFGSRTIPGVKAVEVSNGSPYSIDQLQPKRSRMVEMARQHDLAPISGSDNHGWGYTAPNWTLMRLPKWRAMDRSTLAERIEGTLRERGFEATRVIERTTATASANVLVLSFSVVTVPWRMMTTLSAGERLSWLAWIGALAWARRPAKERRRRTGSAAGSAALAPAARSSALSSRPPCPPRTWG